MTIINYRSHQIGTLALDADSMEGEEEEDSNSMLIKMLAKAQGPEQISAFPGQRKQSQVSNEEKNARKDSHQQPNPLFT